MSKFCRYCGKPKREEARFCRYCGRSFISEYQRISPDRGKNTVKNRTGKKSVRIIVPVVSAAAIVVLGVIVFTGHLTNQGDKVKDSSTFKIKNAIVTEAKGTVENEGLKVSFQGNSGEAVLAQDNGPLTDGAQGQAYDIVLDEDADTNLTIILDEPDSKDGVTNRIKMGLPYEDSDGNKDFLYFPLETITKDGTISAEVDLSDYSDAVEDFMFAGGKSVKNNTDEYGKHVANAAKAKRLKPKYSLRIFEDSVYEVVSGKGLFSVNVPVERYREGGSAKPGKLRAEDAQRLGDDLDRILADYKAVFLKNTRTRYPVPVEMLNNNSVAGGYGGGSGLKNVWRQTQNYLVLYLNFNRLGNGYKDGGVYDDSSNAMFHTIAHELFHFIQWEYTHKSLRALWFDEATAVYYEQEEGDKAGEKRNDNPYYNDPGDFSAIRQYDGVIPASTFFVTPSSAANDGYGRRALIEYLVKECGSDFMPKVMRNYTVKSAGKPMEDLLTKQSGKTMKQMARGYYDSLVAKNELKGHYIEPWKLYLNSFDNGTLNLLKYNVITYSKINKKSENRQYFYLPRYGAHFIALDFQNMPARYESFSIKLDTADTSAILLDITGENYEHVKAHRSWDGGLDDISIDADSYLLMVINESDKHYSGGSKDKSASISVNLKDINDGRAGNFPQKSEQVPAKYEGVMTQRIPNKTSAGYDYKYKTVYATANVILNDSSGSLTAKIISNSDKDVLYSGNLKYDPSTGQGSNKVSSVQFEKGKYDPENYGGDSFRIRMVDNSDTGLICNVFDGLGWLERKEEEEKKNEKKSIKSGGLHCVDEINDTAKDKAFGWIAPGVLFNNAFKNATVTIGGNGSIKGSGSWEADYSDIQDDSTFYTSGKKNLKQSISVKVSFSGSLSDDDKGKFTVSGEATLSGNSNYKGRQETNSTTRTETINKTWDYNFSIFGGEGRYSITTEDGVLIDLYCDAKATGKDTNSEKLDNIYKDRTMADRDQHLSKNDSYPMDKEVGVSCGVKYVR